MITCGKPDYLQEFLTLVDSYRCYEWRTPGHYPLPPDVGSEDELCALAEDMFEVYGELPAIAIARADGSQEIDLKYHPLVELADAYEAMRKATDDKKTVLDPLTRMRMLSKKRLN